MEEEKGTSDELTTRSPPSGMGVISRAASILSSTSVEDDEEQLLWAAIERLPTYDRLRKGILSKSTDGGKVTYQEVNIEGMQTPDRKELMTRIIRYIEEDNEKFLLKLRARIDLAGIKLPKIEVRFENLSVEGESHIGSRNHPSLLNSSINAVEGLLGCIGLAPSKKKKVKMLTDVSGILKPSRLTLLLGPPSSGKTTLLRALSGKLDSNLKTSGKVTYCGHEMNEFVPQRMSAYISQNDVHYGAMTVRETLQFSGRCFGVGAGAELLAELSRREIENGTKPDPDIDAFMKSNVFSGQRNIVAAEYIIKILGLDVCADTMVGDGMRRGISGGQKKRLTTGEMTVGTAKAFFMDEISTGLDSATTYEIVKFMKQLVHILDVTMVISLLQPAPETFDLFDDIILLSDSQIVYQGPNQSALSFFHHMGFTCPPRKSPPDFLQEITSKKDQQQYWSHNNSNPHNHITVSQFVSSFSQYAIGRELREELSHPYDRSLVHPHALVKNKYGISNFELLKVCFDREWLLTKRNSFVYIFKICQISIMAVIAMTVFLRTEMEHGKVEDGGKFLGALFFSLINVMFNGMAELSMTVAGLPVFYKQRDFLFYPAWAYGLPIWLLRIPLSVMESTIWVCFTYYTIGFAPSVARFFKQLLAFVSVHQMALSLFRFIGSVGRTEVIANTLGTFTLLLVFVLGGFIISKNDIQSWMMWGYYISPMMYGQNAIVINEFLNERWSTNNTDPRVNEPTVGKVILESRGFFKEEYWFWICVGALVGFSLLFNLLFIAALTYLNPISGSKYSKSEEDENRLNGSANGSSSTGATAATSGKGMVLPFRPLSLSFSHISYFVDMPAEMKKQGADSERLQLLRDVSGSFRPGVLTALVGVSGAGKTTLMDVLAGRKTGGYIEGNIYISGYLKNQATFARVSGYCEQNDIHSPHVTVYESLVYSAWLRLPSDVDAKTKTAFVEEVMEVVELNPLRNTLVGIPGVDGLSTEQRKRLTIAVELVANPSIIFMDEPTSGLDARAAAIVMRTVRNTVDTGRTVVCTIHQPSIDIFEAFDELLLMKRGGQVIYAGHLGRQSHMLVEYFEAISGVPKIKDGYNPATWMLEVSTPAVEAQLGVDFAEIYVQSSLYGRNQEQISEFSTPVDGSSDLHFPTKYSQSFLTQCSTCFWKQNCSYWRNSQYNAIRFFMTFVIGLLFGLIFWKTGQKVSTQQEIMNLLGCIYSSVFFLGASNTSSVMSIISVERTVFYRERAAGMYSALPYAFSMVAIEAVYVAIQSLVYSLLLYSMIGFSWEGEKVAWFYFYMFTSFIYFTLYGMMVVALTPNHAIAAITMSFFLSFWNLFSGFLIPRTLIPIWWRWYYWGSPVAWTIYGLVTSQIGDLTTDVEIPGSPNKPVDVFLKDYFGFKHGFLPVIAIGHVAWVAVFFAVFTFSIKFINFQKR